MTSLADRLLAHVTLPGVRDALVGMADEPLLHVREAPSDKVALKALSKASADEALNLARVATSATVLEKLWKDRRVTVRREVILNPHTPESIRQDALKRWFEDKDPKTLQALIGPLDHADRVKFLLTNPRSLATVASRSVIVEEAVECGDASVIFDLLSRGHASLAGHVLVQILNAGVRDHLTTDVVERVFESIEDQNVKAQLEERVVIRLLSIDDSLDSQAAALAKYSPKHVLPALRIHALEGRSVVPLDGVISGMLSNGSNSYALFEGLYQKVTLAEKAAWDLHRLPEMPRFSGDRVELTPEVSVILARHPGKRSWGRHVGQIADTTVQLEILQQALVEGKSLEDVELYGAQLQRLLEAGATVELLQPLAPSSPYAPLPESVRKLIAREGTPDAYVRGCLSPVGELTMETLSRPDVGESAVVNRALVSCLLQGGFSREVHDQIVCLFLPETAATWLRSDDTVTFEDVVLYVEGGPGSRSRRLEVIQKAIVGNHVHVPWHTEAVRTLPLRWGDMVDENLVAQVIAQVFEEALGDNGEAWKEVLDLLPTWTLTLDDLVAAAQLTGIR